MNATIRRNPGGKYFVSILTEVEVQLLDKTGSSVGFDVGLKDFATLSDGTVYENPKFSRALEGNLVKAQRILSGRQVGSSNWYKQRIKVARIYEKVTNVRNRMLSKS